MNELLKRLKKASKIELSDTLSDSSILNNKQNVQTPIPALNIALSGEVDGGLSSGLTMIVGESKSFKTLYSLICAKAYLDKYPDGVLLFYDSEMGASQAYFNSLGIDTERVFHAPITDIEQLKFDIMGQLEEIKRGDHVIIVVDSIGNLASKKEVEDALNEKSNADLTRARQLKSMTRMVTPHLNLKDIPMIVINHVYDSLDLFSKKVVSGGCLVAGTKVQMSDETTRCIEDIKVDDRVATKDGIQRVIRTWNPQTLENGTPQCYEIEFEDGTTIICSDTHKFMLDGQWVEAKNLHEGDDLQVA